MTAMATAERIEELQQRVHRMQGTASSRPLPTLPALTPVVQLRSGTSYSTDSPLLAMMLLAGPSQAGAWAAVVGVPEFGLEAASALGVVLERTVVVPEPGAAWLSVVGALAEVMGVVVARPSAAVPPTQAERLSSRLRQRDSTLIALTGDARDWPRPEARLTLQTSSWSGIGRGHGHLAARRATVTAERGGRLRQTELWLPGGVPVVELPAAEARADLASISRLPTVRAS
ncbi:MAG: hypothetical protein ACR2LI_04940 [Propionibacteriaceae bacterium]